MKSFRHLTRSLLLAVAAGLVLAASACVKAVHDGMVAIVHTTRYVARWLLDDCLRVFAREPAVVVPRRQWERAKAVRRTMARREAPQLFATFRRCPSI